MGSESNLYYDVLLKIYMPRTVCCIAKISRVPKAVLFLLSWLEIWKTSQAKTVWHVTEKSDIPNSMLCIAVKSGAQNSALFPIIV